MINRLAGSLRTLMMEKMKLCRCFPAMLMTLILLSFGTVAPAQTGSTDARAKGALTNWYRLVLELVRHTPTYSPPVASRAFAYIGVTGYEAVASGSGDMISLAGQLNGLGAAPPRDTAQLYDEAVVLDAALATAVQDFFANTGPTGQRAMAAMAKSQMAAAATGVDSTVAARSQAYGELLALHIIDWSKTDGGAVIENMGFPLEYPLAKGDGLWIPTNLIRQQQLPLLPNWGKNRTFSMPETADCGLPAPTDYSEDPASALYKQAVEVMDIKANLTDEQKKIARFWSDDPMLSPTPPGHWVSIALQILQRDQADINTSVDVMARLGISVADAFIANWKTKYQYNTLRPITYIRKMMEPKWDALLITPPFPEYPSGHSTQSGAAATVLTAIWGDGFAFEDATHADDGMAPRPYPSFWAAADEAALSRIYGGIHFRPGIEDGLDQGRCVGGFVNALKTLEE